MSLPACLRCGEIDPHRMIGLMTLWFASYAELEPGSSYFHLCPSCYGDAVEPYMDEVRSRVAELHPKAVRRAGGAEGPEPEEGAKVVDVEAGSGEGVGPGSDAGTQGG